MNTNSLDFKQIRPYKKGKNDAFEELVCQLARLSPPENADYFVRKEGSGGDAGVECFWKLKDGSEHGWQAKYFIENFKHPQWDQINQSVKTALEEHSKLTKYYICLPLDRTDQRKKNQESQLNKWDKKVEEWKNIAISKSMNVEFVFWGASEILGMLSTDNPHFSGRALYWFNSPILRIQYLKDIAEKSKQSLGERFSPEFHVDLPIANSFDGIGLTPNWYNRFFSTANKWISTFEKFQSVIKINETVVEEKWKEELNKIHTTYNKYKIKVKKLNDLLEQIVRSKSILYTKQKELSKIFKDCPIEISFNHKAPEYLKQMQYFHNRFMDATSSLSNFVFSKDMKAFSIKSMLLSGDAGAGKSHLLCDVTLNRLEHKLPTLFLLGQHYEGGNPLKFIAQSLDLVNHSHKTILGALDALGEAHSSRTLIIIDAINEGPYKKEWEHHIVGVIEELYKYPHIALMLSCRSTYLQYILPQIKNSGKNQQEAKLTVEIEHKGFSDLGDIYKYLEKQDIFVPNTPIMEPEFSNPLFLKIYCKTLKVIGEKRFSQESKSIETIFNFYVDSISKIINKRKQYRTEEKIVSKVLHSFALQLFPNHLEGLQVNKAREIIKAEDPTPNTGCLLNELLNEGILSEDITSIPYKTSEFSSNEKEKNPINKYEYRKELVVRFTYERFSDYFIVKSLVEKEIHKKPKKIQKIINQIKYFFYRIISKEYCLENENLKIYFKKNSTLGCIFFNNERWIFNGIIEALFTRIADDFKVELYDLIEIEDKKYLLEEFLKKSFLWRSPNSFTLRTLELLSQLKSIYFLSPILQIILKLSIKPNHPWNADFMHKILLKRTLTERDKFWSIHISTSYRYNEDVTIKNLIDWPYLNKIENIDSECIRLYTITLIWFTTSSHRELRDKATQSAIIVLSKYPKYLIELMNKFSKVDDLYVMERLYAIAYGVIVNIEDEILISKISNKIYQQVFSNEKPIPHILLRDYAKCALEFAYSKKLLSDSIDPQKFRPPYKSDWPIENPLDSEINTIVKDDKNVGSVHHSLMGFPGDFGRYSMNCVHKFSPTSLKENKPETGRKLQEKFEEILKKDKYCDEYIKKINSLKEEYCETISILDNNFKDIPDHRKNSVSWTSLFDQQNGRYNEYSEQFQKIQEQYTKEIKVLKEKLKKLLNEEQREQFRWLFEDKYMGERQAPFSRKWVQRWVCKKVYEMGWKKELFAYFDDDVSSYGINSPKIERIGKKYQWIAFHTLMAHLADNVHYIGRCDEETEYKGPWQLYLRDIDPTVFLIKSTSSSHDFEIEENIFQKTSDAQPPKENINLQKKWLDSKGNIPEFNKLLQIKNWTVLNSFIDQKYELSPHNQEHLYAPGLWFRINAIIISKNDRKDIIFKLKDKDLCGTNIIGNSIERFLKEYPKYFKEEERKYWETVFDTNMGNINFKYLTPVTRYSWESNNQNLSINVPTPTLVNKLNLSYPPGQFEYWINNKKEEVFADASIQSKKLPCDIIKTSALNKWLNQENLCLIWIIGGEKRLYGKDRHHNISHKFSGIYSHNDQGEITGNTWFLRKERMGSVTKYK